jgi:hypothetical protein
VSDLTLSAVRQQIGEPHHEVPLQFSDSANQARAEAIELAARNQFLELRSRWSIWLQIWISCLLVFQLGLTVCVGIGKFHFEQYQWFLSMVMVQSFGQIVGMGYIIVRFLYPPDLKKMLAK